MVGQPDGFGLVGINPKGFGPHAPFVMAADRQSICHGILRTVSAEAHYAANAVSRQCLPRGKRLPARRGAVDWSPVPQAGSGTHECCGAACAVSSGPHSLARHPSESSTVCTYVALRSCHSVVIPAEAGIHAACPPIRRRSLLALAKVAKVSVSACPVVNIAWIPAFAGMTISRMATQVRDKHIP